MTFKRETDWYDTLSASGDIGFKVRQVSVQAGLQGRVHLVDRIRFVQFDKLTCRIGNAKAWWKAFERNFKNFETEASRLILRIQRQWKKNRIISGRVGGHWYLF